MKLPISRATEDRAQTAECRALIAPRELPGAEPQRLGD